MDELVKELEFALGVYNSKIVRNNQTTAYDYLGKLLIYKDYREELKRILNQSIFSTEISLLKQLFDDYDLKFRKKHLLK